MPPYTRPNPQNAQVTPEGRNLPANTGDVRDVGSTSGKMPWRRAWQPTPVFLPGESHGKRSLAGYSSWVCKEVDMTEATEHAQNAQNLF